MWKCVIPDVSEPALFEKQHLPCLDKIPLPPDWCRDAQSQFRSRAVMSFYYFLFSSFLTAFPNVFMVYGFFIYLPTPTFFASLTYSDSAYPLTIIAFWFGLISFIFLKISSPSFSFSITISRITRSASFELKKIRASFPFAAVVTL